MILFKMARGVQQAPPPLKMRISKGYGWFMIFVGMVFDFLALILILISVVFVLSQTGGFFMGNAQHISDLADKWCTIAETGVGNRLELSQADRNCRVYTKMAPGVTEMAVKAEIGWAMLFASGTLFTFGPILYIFGSFLSLVLGYITFTIWFFTRGVNIWSVTKPKRIAMTALTGFLESLPLLNLLPGITFLAWRHVKMTQTEDKVKHMELVKNQMSVIRGGGRRMPRYQRAA